ncbi:MAG: rhomboid family intramembrane serine protease [Planctomycetota bacterium]
MRILTEIEGKSAAEKFVAYLLTTGIDTHIEKLESSDDQWEVWVREEDKLVQANEELEKFQKDPGAAKYELALMDAQQILLEREKAKAEYQKNLQKASKRSPAGPGIQGGRIPPLTLTLVIICIAIGVLSNFGRPAPGSLGAQIYQTFSFVSFKDFVESEEDPAASLKQGEIWRAITPCVLHGDIFHLAINMFVLVSFGRIVERWVDTPRFALLVLLLAVVPNLLQGLMPMSLQGSPFFVGISGVTCGLVSYVWIRTSINPSHGIMVPFPFIVITIGLIVVGLADIIPDWKLADLAHLGGLLVGAAIGYASEQ